MYKLLDWYKQYRLDMIAAKSAADNRHTELLTQLVDGQLAFFRQWLTSWQAVDVPAATVVRDEDKVAEEDDRARAALRADFPDIDAATLRDIQQSLFSGNAADEFI